MDLPEHLKTHPQHHPDASYLADLARLGAAFRAKQTEQPSFPNSVEEWLVNPSVELLLLAWTNLPAYFYNQSVIPLPGEDRVLIWHHPEEKTVFCRSATGHDLLALKMIWEHLDSRDVARETGHTIGEVDNILYTAHRHGLLLRPQSRITRPKSLHRSELDNSTLFTTPTFTLQWHITQKCDLHCRHCYDRSDRVPMTLEQGIQVLDDLYDFCRQQNVYTQVSFSGGNPFMCTHFETLYQEAADRGFLTAILGNPVPVQRLEKILAIQKPAFYQISLEGLQPHNDYIRGNGHFRRSLDFLDVLAELDIFSMVMLTLTRANQDQVIKLGQLLNGKVNLFTFNRLAMVGEGAALESVPIPTFEDFLKQYLQAAAKNPHMRLKDNLFNLVRHQNGQPVMGGCAGYGCGAAFNFLALLPDGEVHACRKLPSKLGNIYKLSLYDIYTSQKAEQYRNGPSECADCTIRPACGGCLAVSYGLGLDIFRQRDPYCFL